MENVAEIAPTQLSTEDAEDWAIGPGSVTWKVLRDPVVFMVGQIRNSMVLLFHPPFAASSEHDIFVVDPLLRFRRVGMYAYSATFGKRKDAQKFSHMVRTRHGQVVGTEPITQRPLSITLGIRARTHIGDSVNVLSPHLRGHLWTTAG